MRRIRSDDRSRKQKYIRHAQAQHRAQLRARVQHEVKILGLATNVRPVLKVHYSGIGIANVACTRKAHGIIRFFSLDNEFVVEVVTSVPSKVMWYAAQGWALRIDAEAYLLRQTEGEQHHA